MFLFSFLVCSFYAVTFYDSEIVYSDGLIVSKLFSTKGSCYAIAYDRTMNLLFWTVFQYPDTKINKAQLQQQSRFTNIMNTKDHVGDISLDTFRQLVIVSVTDKGLMVTRYSGTSIRWIYTNPRFLSFGLAVDMKNM